MKILDHLVERLPGVLGMKPGHAFALGHVATLPTCEERRRGEKRWVNGGAGVADREVVCRKSGADAYAWADAPITLTVLTGTVAWDVPSTADGANAITTLTVTGAAVGDVAGCGHTLITGNWQSSGLVSAANTCRCVFRNVSGGPLDLGSGTLRCTVLKH